MLLSSEITVKEIFLSACVRNDLDLIGSLLAIGADVNWKDELRDGESGLHTAAEKNYMELLELLLAYGCDVNIKNNINNGKTPLMVACLCGHEDIARRLCQVSSIEINARDEDGRTALYWAVVGNQPSCVNMLRDVVGVNWNVRTEYSTSPLTRAVECGRAGILQILLSVPPSNLDLNVTDSSGRNIAQIAVEVDGGDRQRCVELLSRDGRVDWNKRNSQGDTPLHFCLKNDKTEMARCLINTPGVDLDIADSDGQYPETIARRRNLREILDMMWGANRNNIQSRVPECPVCLVQFTRDSEVHQCGQGHFVCGVCRPRVRNCPTCRGIMTGRCHGFEDFLQALNID